MKRLHRHLLVFLLTACGEGGGAAREYPPDSVPMARAPEPAVASGSDSALALDPVATGWRARELTHLPRYFLAGGWAGADTLWGLAGNTPVFAQVARPEYHALERRYWDASLSPTGVLAGLDERGVFVDALHPARLLIGREGPSAVGEGDLSGPMLWSPDGARLLLRWVREGPALHGVVELATGAVTPVPPRVDALFLGEPFGWVGSDALLFQAHPSFDPERGPVGRGDLALYVLGTTAPRRVASAVEGSFLRPLASWGGESVLVGESTGGTGRPVRYWVYDTRSWSRRPVDLPPADRVVSHDSTRALLVTREDDPRAPLHRVSLWEAGRGARPLLRVRGRDVRLLWSRDGRRVAVSTALEGEDGGSVYRSWVVE